MMITVVSGDPLLTRAQVLAFGFNAKGRSEVGTLETELLYRFPAAFASYGKQARGGRIKPGMVWTWRESQPLLCFLVVRETSVGITRVRYLESALMTLARDYRLQGFTSLALAPLGLAHERAPIMQVVRQWLSPLALLVTVYETYLPDVPAENPPL